MTPLETAALAALVLYARRKDIPPQAYKNGKPLDVRLVAIDDKGHLLSERAAAKFVEMRAAAAKVGIALVVESAFRTMEQQTALWVAYQKGERTDVVGQPGYSNHQAGDAVDLTTARGTNAAYAWLRSNAHLFGFYETVRSEPWHWEHRA